VQHDAQAWFLAQIRPNSAQIALRNLARQGFVTFFPQEEGTRRSRGRFEPVLKPLFPGYARQPIAASGDIHQLARGAVGLRGGRSAIRPSKPVTSATIPASSAMLTSVPVPTLIWLSIGCGVGA
jgi:hypothetical protein